MFYKKFLKRVIDICFSFLTISLLLPLFILTSILIKFDSKGPRDWGKIVSQCIYLNLEQ